MTETIDDDHTIKRRHHRPHEAAARGAGVRQVSLPTKKLLVDKSCVYDTRAATCYS